MPGKHAAPYDEARDTPTTYRPKHRRPTHRGVWDDHDRRVWETADRNDGVPVLGGSCSVCRPKRGKYARREVGTDVRARLTEAARREWDALPEQSKAAFRRADQLARDEADLIRQGGPLLPVPALRVVGAEEAVHTVWLDSLVDGSA